MIKNLILVIFATLLAQSAAAGPWLREKGTAFVATSLVGNYYLDTSSQTYLEYGLTGKTTVIADIGFLRPRFAFSSGSVTLSMRRALSKPDATSKWAYELGVGVGWVGEETLPHIRTALSWGRGIKVGEKYGWTTVEAAGFWGIDHPQDVIKIDGTLGLNFTDVTSGMLQLYTAHYPEGSVATFAPSLIFNPKQTKFRIQIGAESEIGNHLNSALKISLWREF